ncbi:MAG: glycosyltransferase family 87 protein [Candidatus Zixiibacteriota bacterium]
MKSAAVKTLKYIIILFSAVSVVVFFWQSIRNHNYIPNGNDLTSYLTAGWMFFSGENPYAMTVRRYIYPLFLLIVTYPLAFLQSGYFQKAVTASLWSLLAYFAFFKTVFASWNFLYGYKSTVDWLKSHFFRLALLFFLLHTFLQSEFLNGQVNLVVMGLGAGYFFMLQKDRQFAAAALLAVAAAIKIAPGLCLVYALCTRQYKTVFYFVCLLLAMVLVLPLALNGQTLDYYGYFVKEVLPIISKTEAAAGFKSFSLLSTFSHLLHITWHPQIKVIVLVSLAAVLMLPVYLFCRKHLKSSDSFYRLSVFAAIVSALPLTFPMSEGHHLLVLTVPLLVIIAYFEKLLCSGASLKSDRMALWFAGCLVVLHIGQGLPVTPLRFLALAGIYLGLLALIKSKNEPAVPEPCS